MSFFECEENLTVNFIKNTDLKNEKNKNQYVSLWNEGDNLDYEVFNCEELTYDEYADASCAISIAAEFYDVNACVIVKNQLPTGVALGKNLNEACQKAFDTDSIASIESVFAFSKELDENTASDLSKMLPKVVICPEFNSKVLEILSQDKKIKLVKINTPLKEFKNYLKEDIKITPFGALIKAVNKIELTKDNFEIMTKQKPTKEQIEDLVFAWKVSKYINSYGVVIAKDLKTISIVSNFTNKIDVIEYSLNKVCDSSKDAIMACDFPIELIEHVNAAIQGRIKAVIQNGLNSKTKELAKIFDKYQTVLCKY